MFCFLLCLLLVDHPATQFAALRAEARTHFKAGDYAEMLAVCQRLHGILPAHVPTRYNLVLAHALNKQPDQALAMLADTAGLGVLLPLPEGEPFDVVRQLPGYAVFEKHPLMGPIGRAETAITLPDPTFFPEGVAYDPLSKAFFISSVRQNKIMRFDGDGKLGVFVHDPKLKSVLGIAVDAKRRLLWATSSDLPQSDDETPEEHGTAGVFAFQLDSGAVHYHSTLPGTGHNLGDLTLDSNGNVYLSDGMAGVIYHLPQGGGEPTVFLTSPWLSSPQGLAFSQDESLLYVADYRHGLLVVDMKDKAIVPMKSGAGYAGTGIDGLVRHGQYLIAIQNAYAPHRVVRWRLLEDGRSIGDEQILLANHPLFDEPTLGTVVGTDFYLVANSQWGRYDKNNKPLPLAQLKTPHILRLSLK